LADSKEFSLSPGGLELERKTIGETDYNRDYNATFLEEEFSYFPSKLVLACTDHYALNYEPKLSDRYAGRFYLGVDLGKHADSL